MRLLKLDERVQQMLIDDIISSGHGRTLLAIDDKNVQYTLAMKVLDDKLSVRETEKEVKKLLKNNPKKEKEEQKVDDKKRLIYKDLEEKMKEKMGTKVSINQKGNSSKGKIEIEYYSEEELERIVDMLMTVEGRKKMEVFDYVGIDIGYVLLGTIAFCFIMFITLIVVLVKQKNLKKKYNAFMGGNDAKALEEIIIGRFREVEYVKEQLGVVDLHLKQIDETLLTTYKKMALLKYDAFREMGGNLSFAIALLTEKNDGFIINAMHSTREGCYIYAKEIVKGQCDMTLSEEEQQVLADAMNKKLTKNKKNICLKRLL